MQDGRCSGESLLNKDIYSHIVTVVVVDVDEVDVDDDDVDVDDVDVDDGDVFLYVLI